MIIADKLFR